MGSANRREFLADVGRGMLVASVGSAMALDLGLTPALAELALQSERRHEVAVQLAGPEHYRGRSCFRAPLQVAESFIRQHLSELSGPALAVTGDQAADGSWHCTVTHTDGRRWTVAITGEDGPELKASCAKVPGPSTVWRR